MTNYEYAAMGGAIAGGVADMSSNLSTASNSAFDGVNSTVMAIDDPNETPEARYRRIYG